MALILEQVFLTGRFHATRWNQSPFEDIHGEWPPSPYRLLRALAARWFEHARETADRDSSKRDGLLACLANQLPAFHLPDNAVHTATWAARGIKQYLPTELVKSDKKRGEPWVLRHQTTLFLDAFQLLPSNAPVYWFWPELELSATHLELLDELLRRITYFGRAESLCLMRRLGPGAPVPAPNCTLSADNSKGSPVLVSAPATPLNLDILLANNDDALLRGRRIPSATCWVFATRPPKPIATQLAAKPIPPMLPAKFMQFAIGGRVLPPAKAWLQVTEKFRGCVLKNLRKLLFGQSSLRGLTSDQHEAMHLMTGRHADGTLVEDHTHVSFWLLPDLAGKPTRLVCFRPTPFNSVEQQALLLASEELLRWQFGNPDWALRIVPLPGETLLPLDANPFGLARSWHTVTPYVPSRHTIGRNGKPKLGESVEEQIIHDLELKRRTIAQTAVHVVGSRWIKAHQPRSADSGQSNRDKRGYDILLQFSEPQAGPIALGHSCHFGLGLFVPVFS